MTTVENNQILRIDQAAKKLSMNEATSLNNNTNVRSCAVTMAYLGRPMIQSNGSYTFKIHPDEVLILQSHTATGTRSVFKGCLKPNDKFTFKSYRLIDRYFAITIYINDIVDQQISTCCEAGFVYQSHLQTRWTSCQLQSITGGIPCETCQPREMSRSLAKETTYDDASFIPLINLQPFSHSPPMMFANQTIKEATPSKTNYGSFNDSTTVTDINKDDNQKTILLDTTDGQHKPIQESSEPKASENNEKQNNMTQEVDQQDTQLIDNMKVSKDVVADYKQTDPVVSSKISNEDKKTKISAAASLQMEQLLTGYLKLLLPQTKSSTSNPEPNNAIQSLTYSSLTVADRETKAKMQYTESTTLSTIESKTESFFLIWLDQTINKNQDTIDSEQKLRAIVNSLVTCHTINQAMDFIDQVQDQQIYLIVSGELGKQLVSMKQITESPKLNSIYIFCRERSKYTELVQQSNKVRDVFVDINSLCARLKEDTEQALKNLLPMSTTSGSSADEKNQVKFLCSQLHRDLLFTMEYNNNARLELVDYCSDIYKSNPADLKFIEELRTEYHAGKAISWYTRQTFLFKMLNAAFQTRDISILYKFHFYIKDLHTRLEQMHSLYRPSLESRIFPVYRGLSMTLEEFEKTIRAEINNLIAFDSFLSTSLNENVAKRFALNKCEPKTESVVFCMEIDADQMERPFADISRWSQFKEEREVLFSIGTVFRIVHVADKKTKDGIWIVRLSTVSEKDEQLQKQTQQTQITLLRFFESVLCAHKEANDSQKIPASNANVASMFYKQGEYNDSLLFYQKALEALEQLDSPDALTKATYISNVAKVHMALGCDDKALDLYKKALSIRRQECESNDPSLIHTLHTIGHIYQGKENWNEAFEQFNEALKLQRSPSPSRPLLDPSSRLLSDPSSIAISYVCMGNILNCQERYPEALDSFSNALKQQHEHLSKDHPVLAFLYNNIGAMQYKTKKYDEALSNQLNCLAIESKALPKEHRTFAETYKNIATTYEKLRRFDEALEFAQKYIDQLKLHVSEDSDELKEANDLMKAIQISRDNRK